MVRIASNDWMRCGTRPGVTAKFTITLVDGY